MLADCVLVDVIHVKLNQVVVAEHGRLENLCNEEQLPRVNANFVLEQSWNHDGIFARLDCLDQILNALQEAAPVHWHSRQQVHNRAALNSSIWHLAVAFGVLSSDNLNIYSIISFSTSVLEAPLVFGLGRVKICVCMLKITACAQQLE